MGGETVLWAETSDDDAEESAETEAHGGVDETFAARRLRRWLKGMFGGESAERTRGNQQVPPTETES